MALPHKISTLLYGFNARDEVLLLERAQEPNRGLWSPCGGKLKTGTGESPYACACREAFEELGLHLAPDQLHLTGIVSERGYEGQAHWLMFLFEIGCILDALPPPIREGRFAFFPREALDRLRVPRTDRERIWPLFWRHRGGFFAAHCDVQPGNQGHAWIVEESRPPVGPQTPRHRAADRSLPLCRPPRIETRQPDEPHALIDLHSDDHFMAEALRQARRAYAGDEVPVGAVVVRAGSVIARAFNQVELLKDATAHAEMLALTQAQAATGDWRLTDCTLYVTKEPCAMCAGAMVQARVGRVVFGAADPKAGAAGGILNLVQFPTFNHRCALTVGVRQEECRRLLRQFFAAQRASSVPNDGCRTTTT